MPTIDIPYIVGVIREKEKALLEDDEYIRVISAATNPNAAREALADTAYGIHVAADMTSLEALDARLTEEFDWLAKMLGTTDKALTFISARYDALHAAAAIIDYKDGKEKAEVQVAIGTLTPELLTSVIWQDAGWDDVPSMWKSFLQEQVANTKKADWSRKAVTAAAADQAITVMQAVGKSPLMKAVTALAKERTETEEGMRPDTLPDDISAYEKQWDERLLSALREHRLDPHTIDSVVAWWYALATEVKTLRLLLTAAGGGVAKETVTNLTRSRYLSWI